VQRPRAKDTASIHS